MNAGRQKVEREGRCRVCGASSRVCDAAHVWDRSLGKSAFDDPDLIVPLCSDIKGGQGCHQAYDQHRLELLPYLTRDEELAIVRVAGLGRAYNRVTVQM